MVAQEETLQGLLSEWIFGDSELCGRTEEFKFKHDKGICKNQYAVDAAENKAHLYFYEQKPSQNLFLSTKKTKNINLI